MILRYQCQSIFALLFGAKSPSEQAHLLEVLFVFWKWISFAPAFQFEGGQDVMARGFCCFVSPQLAHFLNAG